MLIGVAIGFALQLVFDALALGGQLLVEQHGPGFAFNVDPLRGSSTPVLGQLYMHPRHADVPRAERPPGADRDCSSQGFTTLPVGTTGLGQAGLWNVVSWGGQLFAGALAVALPGMTALLVVNLAFGVMSRAAPSLNLFAVGFPVSLIVGLLIVLAGLPSRAGEFHRRCSTQAFDFLRALLGGG